MSEILISDKYCNWIEFNWIRRFCAKYFLLIFTPSSIIMLEGNADYSLVDSEWWSSIGEWTTLLFISHSPLTIEILINLLRIHNVQCKDSQWPVYCVLSCIYLFSMSIKWTMDSPKHIDSKITIIRSLSQNRFYPHIRSSQFVYSVYWSDRSNATPNHTNVTLKNNQFNWIKFKRFVVVFVSTRFFWFKCH